MEFSSKFINIQERYLDILDDRLGEFLSPYNKFPTEKECFEYFDKNKEVVEQLSNDLNKLWKTEDVKNEIKNYNGLKTLFYLPGYLPSSLNKFVTRTGLFVDLIVLTDPIYHPTLNGKKSKFLFYGILQNAHKIHTIASNFRDVDHMNYYPFVFAPPPKQDQNEFLQKKTMEYLSEVSGYEINSQNDLIKLLMDEVNRNIFYKKLDGREVKFKDKIMIITPHKHMSRMIGVDRQTEDIFYKASEEANQIFEMSFGLEKAVYESINYPKEFYSHSVFDDSGFYKLFNDRTREYYSQNDNITIVSALQHRDLRYLGNLSYKDFIKVRMHKDFESLREVFKENIDEMENTEKEDLQRVASHINENISKAIKKNQMHQTGDRMGLIRRYGIRGLSTGVAYYLTGSIGISAIAGTCSDLLIDGVSELLKKEPIINILLKTKKKDH